MDFLENRVIRPMKGSVRKNQAGFTLIELSLVSAIIGIMICIAVPAFLNLREGYELNQAARDLYSNMQRAKIMAVKINDSVRIFFDPTPGRQCYEIWLEGPNRVWDKMTGDDVLQRRIYLSDYDPGITFGPGNAKYAATTSKGKIPADGISYLDKHAHFKSNVMVGKLGYVYLRNQKGENYAVGTNNNAGFIVLKKWRVNSWD